VPDFEGVAIEGKGVFETLSCVSKQVTRLTARGRPPCRRTV
jgi:hypothetical protein